LQPIDKNPEDPLIRLIANIVPILNGRDSDGKVIYLGPQTTKIHRYLLVVFIAKSIHFFRLGFGKEIDSSIYFTLYGLGKVADSFKQIGPHLLPIHYDRTKVANSVYTVISNNGLVAMRKIDGETYVKITEKGEDLSTKLLQELIAYAEVVSATRPDSDKNFKVKKGVKVGIGYDSESQKVEKKLADRISEINLQFKSKTHRLDDRRH
jgi:hypothetical protein